MQHETYTLETKAAAATGAAQLVKDLTDKEFQVTGGAFNATLQLEFSDDGGTTWEVFAVVKSVMALPFPHPATHVRVNTTGYVGGAPAVKLVGRQSRSI